MPTLPTWQDVPGPASPQPSGGVAAYEPPNWRQVGMTGYAVREAGNELGQASQIIQATNERQDQVVAVDAANKLRARQLSLEQDPNSGFSNARGNAVIGSQFLKNYGDQWSAAQADIAGSLANENQRRMFDQHAQVLGLQFKSALLQHQAKQTIAYNATTRADTITLGMNDIAAHPYDDKTYETNRLLMGKTVTEAGQDLGLTGDALANYVRVGTAQLDSKALLYRTSGMLVDNAMQASDFFHKHELEFDPQDRMHLAGALKTATDAQTSRVNGQQAYQSAISGQSASPVPADKGADLVKPYTAQHIDDIAVQVRQPSPYDGVFEKWGKAYNVSPTELKLRSVVESGMNKDAVSSQGAVGLMQFTPDTAKKYNIDPKNPEQSIIAAAILMSQAGGTQGDMSKIDRTYYGGNADAKGPNTDQYVENLRAVRQRIMGTAQPQMTQAFLEGSEGRVVDAAKALAQQQRPGDAVYQDQVVAEARKNWASDLAAVRGKNEQTVSDIMSLVAGDTPPKSIGDLPPALQQGYSNLPGTTQESIRNRLSKGDQKLTPEAASAYYALVGQAGSDPEQFAKVDLNKVFGTMPDHLWLGLAGMQKSISAKDAQAATHNTAWQMAHSGEIQTMFKPVIDGKGKAQQDKTSEQFYGRLTDALRTYHEQNGKWPASGEVKQMAGGLLAQGAEKGSGWLWNLGPDAGTRAFQTEPGKFYVPLPSKSSPEYAKIVSGFQKTFGRAPSSDEELQRAATQAVIANGGTVPWKK